MDLLSLSDPKTIEKTLESISLRYVSDAIPGILRLRNGKGFVYKKDNKTITEPRLLERIEKLVIPPAWEHVWIAPTNNAHIQATGRDEKGRKQYIYHEEWNNLMKQNKFNRMIFFGNVLPDIRREVTSGMQERGLTQRRIIATIVWLLGKTFIRVGNEEYAQDNKSYGLTTMRMKHVDVRGDTVRFEFKGKSGKFHSVSVQHPKVAKTIKKLEELPGYELFQYVDTDGQRHTIESSDINDYLKRITGETISAKDFRTWGGTVYAAENLYDEGAFDTQKEATKKISTAVKLVSKHLGNTATVCRAYYIHPAIITAYTRQELIPYFNECKRDFVGGMRLTQHEYATHRLIKKYTKK